jgi:type VI secretion system protein ImpM
MTPQVGCAGLFGKLPARGDFVRNGLPGSFVAPWDAWLQAGLAASHVRLGEDWLPAWLQAPVWRFALAPGVCGPDAAIGVMLPSVDRVGRYFPLTLAALFPPDSATATPDDIAAWLDTAEAAGLAALERDATQEQVAALLPPAPAVGKILFAGSQWWTDGGPHVAAALWRRPGLPAADDFSALLRDPASDDFVEALSAE